MPSTALWLFLVHAGSPPQELERLGRLDHPEIREASGIVASRRHPGIFWVHNDSGNAPALFAVRRDGALVREYQVAVPNIDWEDIALDDSGHLYVGDIGNNGALLPVRVIHRFDEPDPSVPDEKPLRPTLSTLYAFPPADRFDSEGLIVSGGQAILFSKRLDGQEAGVYAVPLEPPGTLFQPVRVRRVGSLQGFPEPVTAADLAPDGLLAVASYTVARVYEPLGGGQWRLIGEARYQADGIEALAWDGPDLILAGEGRGLYRIPETIWRNGLKPPPPAPPRP